MPGAFYPDSNSSTGAAVSQPPLFHPSVSPHADPDSGSSPKRKRVRGGGVQDDIENTVVRPSLFGAHHALAKPRSTKRSYNIAGNLDTGSAANSGLLLDDSIYSESNYRTALGEKRPRDESESQPRSTGNEPTQLFQLPQEPDSPSRGWGVTAVTALGGVVGKVWEFCKAGAFKGFYAGGGAGFALNEDGTVAQDAIGPTPIADGFGFSFHPHNYDDYEQRIPGHFPASQNDQAVQASPAFRTAPPPPTEESRSSTPVATKRRQTEQHDELGRNWVVVDSSASEARLTGFSSYSSSSRRSSSYRSTPRNRNQSASVTTGRRIHSPASTPSARSPISSNFNYRYSAFPEPEADEEVLAGIDRPASSASFASPRSPSPKKGLSSAAYLTPSSSAVHMASTASNASPSQRPRGSGHKRRGSAANTPSHRRNHSTASTASSRGEDLDTHASPRLDAEARHLATRRQLEDRDADMRMSAFNKRLQDMIRQGKEALGTTIEIDESGDEGMETEGGVWEDED